MTIWTLIKYSVEELRALLTRARGRGHRLV